MQYRVCGIHTIIFASPKAFTGIYGVWGMVGFIEPFEGCFMSSCCRGCGVGLPSFPVSPIYTPSWCSDMRLKRLVHEIMLQSFMPSFPVSPKYTLLYLPHDVLIFQFFTTTCYILLLYRFTPNIVPVENGGSSWNFWELAIGERGQLKVKDEKESMPLVDRVAIVAEVHGAVCQLYSNFGTRLWRNENSVVTKHIV